MIYMGRKSIFWHNLQIRSLASSEIDQELEERKIGLVFIGIVVFMILMGLFMWWVKNSLH
jgi:hypothetical protein